jgi:PAS domain S-box-containing protein
MTMVNGQIKKILVIDDDEDDYFIICDYLNHAKDKSYTIDWCYDYEQALDHLKSKSHDLYFVDYKLGGHTGIDILKGAFRTDNQAPIIFLTGKGNKEIDILAMQEGAMDYLVKSELNTEKLERSIRYALERTASLKALRENEKKFRAIFEKSKDAVFITDIHFNFIDLNEATSDLLEISKENLIGKNFLSFCAEEIQKAKVRYALHKGQLDECEIEIKMIDGERKYCIISGVTEADSTGMPYIQCIVHDITDLKRTEKTNLQIEKLAATARLVQTLAHEVRNPLNNINLSVEQLMADNKDAVGTMNTPLFEIIHRNGKRIAKLIDELLASARPTEVEFEKLDLHLVIEEVIAAAKDRMTLQQLKLEKDYTNEEIYINGDVQKLKLALLNIVMNATEAVEPGKGVITIRTMKLSEKNVIQIEDNGTGIPEENLSKLFEPYFTSKRNGMGLGLAASLNILQAHKSNIDVESTLGKGTTFKINFPKA